MPDGYKRPYLDSSAFISYIKGEVVERKTVEERREVVDGKDVVRQVSGVVLVERGEIVTHILTLAESGDFDIYTSALTLAEVHKPRHGERLADTQDERILQFFEHDFIKLIDVDRRIGEDANRFCRQFGILPCDAIHLACALRADCDVLLAWDPRFVERIHHPDIRTEEPRMIGQLRLDA